MMIAIKISNLSEGIHYFDFEEDIKNLGLDEPFLGKILVKIELSKINNQIIVQSDLASQVSFICDRCTKDFGQILSSSFKMVYLFGPEPENNTDINVTYLPFDCDKIVLDNDIRDYLLLSVPMKKLCKEDCKGLCTSCGKDLNEGDCGCIKDSVDSRWRPLMDLKNKLNNN